MRRRFAAILGLGILIASASALGSPPGLKPFESGTWQGVLVPKNTPDAVVQKLNTALITAIRNADVRARLAGQGAEVVTMTPAEQDKFFEAERARWAKVVAEANIKVE